MARTMIATIFRESRGVVLLLMAVGLIAASVMTLMGLQSVEAKEDMIAATTAEPVATLEIGAPTDTTSPAGQLQYGSELRPSRLTANPNDWTYWTELVASGWDGERQWYYYCLFMLLRGRTSTINCWVETE